VPYERARNAGCSADALYRFEFVRFSTHSRNRSSRSRSRSRSRLPSRSLVDSHGAEVARMRRKCCTGADQDSECPGLPPNRRTDQIPDVPTCVIKTGSERPSLKAAPTINIIIQLFRTILSMPPSECKINAQYSFQTINNIVEYQILKNKIRSCRSRSIYDIIDTRMVETLLLP